MFISWTSSHYTELYMNWNVRPQINVFSGSKWWNVWSKIPITDQRHILVFGLNDIMSWLHNEHIWPSRFGQKKSENATSLRLWVTDQTFSILKIVRRACSFWYVVRGCLKAAYPYFARINILMFFDLCEKEKLHETRLRRLNDLRLRFT